MSMNVIFLGAPGSGKGTQAEFLSKDLNIAAISTGDALRKEVANESEIGKLAKSYMESGQLVPDEVVIGIIKNRITKEDCQKGFILDGFPRNISQAQELEKMLNLLNKRIDLVVNFEVDEEILVKRITGRFSCKKCSKVYNKYFNNTKVEGICDVCGSKEFDSRKDDNEETLKDRLNVYRESTSHLIEFYEKKGLLLFLKALKTPPLIFKELKEAINNKNN